MPSAQETPRFPPIPERLPGPAMRLLLRACRAPDLWAFASLAGAVGLGRAVEVCQSREIPPAALRVFEVGRWQAANLPPRELVEQVILAVRVMHLMHLGRNTRAAAEELGTTYDVAARALTTFDRVAHDFTQDEDGWKAGL